MSCEYCDKNTAVIMVVGRFMAYCERDHLYHFISDTCDRDSSDING